MAERKLIVDADPGIGDAVAVALALLDPELDVVAVTATEGAVSAEEATHNVLRIVEQIDPPKSPRVGQATDWKRRLALPHREQRELAQLNGPTGIGDRELPFAPLHHQPESVKLLIDSVKAAPNAVTLVTLGPLTNVAEACQRMPEFLSQVGGLVCLGGSVAVGGDVSAAAELNMFLDPEAARTVLRSPATKTLVPLDVSRKLTLTFDLLARWPGEHCRLGRFLQQILPYALRTHHQFRGVEGCPLKEIVAIAVAARPELFKTELMALDVETQGELGRGMTVFDRREQLRWKTNIEVVTEIDVQGVLDYVAAVLRRGERAT